MAGYTPNGSPSYAEERIGTFFGQTLDDYREANASQDIEMYYVTRGIRAFEPGRLNYYFKWKGPSYCTDAACSSSALSIQMAVAALRSHECDTAVAGGANVLTESDMYSRLRRGSFLSATESCRNFDNDADDYCREEGVESVILKRLNDAIAEGDNIQEVIDQLRSITWRSQALLLILTLESSRISRDRSCVKHSLNLMISTMLNCMELVLKREMRQNSPLSLTC